MTLALQLHALRTMRRPVHPLLLAAFPIVSMYSVVPGRSDAGEILSAVAITVAIVALLWMIVAAVYRDGDKSALLVSASLLVVVLVPESLFRYLEHSPLANWGLGRTRYVLAAATLLLGGIAVLLHRTRRPIHRWTAVANVAGAGLLVVPLLALGSFQIRTFATGTRSGPHIAAPRSTHAVPAPPDIYYIIFDRYGDRRTMASYGVNNDPLYAFLTNHGFYIARDSHANYIKTSLSVSSSLNMAYHDDLAQNPGPESANWLPINYRLREHAVGRFLKEQGYTYIHAGSWWWPTHANRNADENINFFSAVPHPVMLLFHQPLIEPITGALRSAAIDDRLQQWHRVRRQLAELGRVADRPEPTFVFAHILVPHPPYVFDADGSYVSFDMESRRSTRDNYRNQVLFANQMIVHFVRTILSRSSSPPVILLQGDEGPYPKAGGRPDKQDEFRWRDLNPSQLRERSAILNAYHLPGSGAAALYPSISPVNSFRVIFNTYFDTKLPLLRDRIYRHDSENRPYSYADVTDTVFEAERNVDQRSQPMASQVTPRDEPGSQGR